MGWKCPHCNGELKENDVIRGVCPHCHKIFNFPQKIKEQQKSEWSEEKEKVKKSLNNSSKQTSPPPVNSKTQFVIAGWCLFFLLGLMLYASYIGDFALLAFLGVIFLHLS